MSKEDQNGAPSGGTSAAAQEAERIATQRAALHARKRGSALYRALAKLLYSTYTEAVGGRAYNGDALPDAETFFADPAKKKQADAWIETAIEAERAARNKVCQGLGDGLLLIVPTEEFLALQQRACQIESLPEEPGVEADARPGAGDAPSIRPDPVAFRRALDEALPIHPDDQPSPIVRPPKYGGPDLRSSPGG